jgi:hypothetical protein
MAKIREFEINSKNDLENALSQIDSIAHRLDLFWEFICQNGFDFPLSFYSEEDFCIGGFTCKHFAPIKNKGNAYRSCIYKPNEVYEVLESLRKDFPEINKIGLNNEALYQELLKKEKIIIKDTEIRHGFLRERSPSMETTIGIPVRIYKKFFEPYKNNPAYNHWFLLNLSENYMRFLKKDHKEGINDLSKIDDFIQEYEDKLKEYESEERYQGLEFEIDRRNLGVKKFIDYLKEQKNNLFSKEVEKVIPTTKQQSKEGDEKTIYKGKEIYLPKKESTKIKWIAQAKSYFELVKSGKNEARAKSEIFKNQSDKNIMRILGYYEYWQETSPK